MAVEDTAQVIVKSFANHKVTLLDTDNNRRISFAPQEEKTFTAKQIRDLHWKKGNSYILRNYLCVKNEELAREIGVPDDMVEYWYTAKDINDLISKSGNLDEFKDALEFGPEGIRETLVDKSIETEVKDYDKREAVKELTGKDVDTAIKAKNDMEADKEAKPKSTRRASTAKKKTTTSTRRSSTTAKKTTTAKKSE